MVEAIDRWETEGGALPRGAPRLERRTAAERMRRDAGRQGRPPDPAAPNLTGPGKRAIEAVDRERPQPGVRARPSYLRTRLHSSVGAVGCTDLPRALSRVGTQREGRWTGRHRSDARRLRSASRRAIASSLKTTELPFRPEMSNNPLQPAGASASTCSFHRWLFHSGPPELALESNGAGVRLVRDESSGSRRPLGVARPLGIGLDLGLGMAHLRAFRPLCPSRGGRSCVHIEHAAQR